MMPHTSKPSQVSKCQPVSQRSTKCSPTLQQSRAKWAAMNQVTTSSQVVQCYKRICAYQMSHICNWGAAEQNVHSLLQNHVFSDVLIAVVVTFGRRPDSNLGPYMPRHSILLPASPFHPCQCVINANNGQRVERSIFLRLSVPIAQWLNYSCTYTRVHTALRPGGAICEHHAPLSWAVYWSSQMDWMFFRNNADTVCNISLHDINIPRTYLVGTFSIFPRIVFKYHI